MIYLVAGAALLLAACSSGEPEGPDAIDAGFAPAGDEEPDSFAEEDSPFVTVLVDLPSDQSLEGLAIVVLEDVSYASVSARELFRVELRVSELRTQGNMVDVYLPVPLDGDIAVNVSVHIDTDTDGAISQGDWISPNNVLVTSMSEFPVSVPIAEVQSED